MPVRSARLVAARPSGAGTYTTILTVPAGKTYLVKDVRACLLAGTSQSGFLTVQSGGGEYNVMSFTGAFPLVVSLSGFIVLEPGDELKAWQAVSNGISWYVSGAELAGVAPPP